jgi:hypothetical protein
LVISPENDGKGVRIHGLVVRLVQCNLEVLSKGVVVVIDIRKKPEQGGRGRSLGG